MSSVKEFVSPLLEKSFAEMRARISEIERESRDREQVMKVICDYVGTYVSAESKSIVSSLYTKLSAETLNSEPFSKAKNKNIFYEKDIWSMIFDKYSFSTQEKMDYKPTNKSFAIVPPLATTGIGVVLSIALSKAIITPVALVVSAGLYFFICENIKPSNTARFTSAIDGYLEKIKSELLVWFKNIEHFYHQQVNEVIASLKE